MGKQHVEVRGEVTTHLNKKAARDAAEAAGEPYGNIFTTTAGYLNSREGKYVHDEIYLKSMIMNEILYDAKDLNNLRDIIRKNSPGKKLMVLLEYNHRQLGYTDEWLRGKIEDAMASGDAVLADFLNIWVEGSATSAIDKKLLKIISDSIINEPHMEISTYGYITRWYVTEVDIELRVKNREIVLSLDTSDAVGKDDIAMVIRDVRTGAVLAAGQYNETNLITFSEWLVDWIVNYPMLTMIIERRSSGVAILDNLLKLLPAMGIDPFARIFNWIADDAVEYPNRIDETLALPLNRRCSSVYVKYRKYFGFATSGSGRTSREELYGNSLLSSIKYTGTKTRDKSLVNQISGLVVKNGRIDHRAGGHDDLVISYALGYWFLTTARNKEYYGIKSGISLSTVINNELASDGTKDRLESQQYQLALKANIDDYLDRLREERDSVKSTILINKIRYLYRDIDHNYVQSFNLDSIIDNINLEKRKNSTRRY